MVLKPGLVYDRSKFPIYNTKTIDGVDVTAMMDDDGTLYACPNRTDYGSSYIVPTVSDEGGTIEFKSWPICAGDNLIIIAIDGDGNDVAVYYGNELDSKGTAYVEMDYDFSGDGSGGILYPGYQTEGPQSGFETDKLLLICGYANYPATWPEGLETGDYKVNVVDGLDSQYCNGTTQTVTIEIENTKFLDKLTDTVTIEYAEGESENVDLNLDPGNIKTLQFKVDIP